MKYVSLAAILGLAGCSASADRSFDPRAAVTCPEVTALERTDSSLRPRLPGAIWRLAFHGTHDYRAELPVTFDITATGYVVNAEFDRAIGAPQSHNRHLRQSARDHLNDRRYALPDEASGGLARCQDSLVYEFDHLYDE